MTRSSSKKKGGRIHVSDRTVDDKTKIIGGDIEAFVTSSYALATEYLKSHFSYIFKSTDGLINSYTIGTWSHKIKRSSVLKNGTAEDIAKLPPETAYNKEHSKKRTITVGKRRKLNKVAKAGTRKRASMPVPMEVIEEVEGQPENEEEV